MQTPSSVQPEHIPHLERTGEFRGELIEPVCKLREAGGGELMTNTSSSLAEEPPPTMNGLGGGSDEDRSLLFTFPRSVKENDNKNE